MADMTINAMMKAKQQYGSKIAVQSEVVQIKTKGKPKDWIGAIIGHTVLAVQGTEQGTEHTPLRSSNVVDLGANGANR